MKVYPNLKFWTMLQKKMWPKHKDSQVRINWEKQANDNNSWLILSSKGEKEWKMFSIFSKTMQGKVFYYTVWGT